MKHKKILFVGLMLAILTVGAVSASEDIISDDSLAVDDAVDESIAEVDDSNQDEDLAANDEEAIGWDEEDVLFPVEQETDMNKDEIVGGFVSRDTTAVGDLEVYVDNTLRANTTVKASDYKYSELNGFDVCEKWFYPNQLGISSPGIYTIKAIFDGVVLTNQAVYVYKDVPIVDAPDAISVGENDAITISDPTKRGTSAEITIERWDDNKDKWVMVVNQTISVVNGQASYSLSGLAEGEYFYNVNYPVGTSCYKSGYLDVYQNSPGFTFSASPSELTAGNTVTVTLTGPKLMYNVDMYVDGKFYKALNLSSGSASEVLSGLGVGTHKVKVYYVDEYFYSNTLYVTVKSAPAPVQSQTSDKKVADKISLSLKKVKIKKSAKKLVLSATLKINKKAVKGKVIKFKFKGKTYKAKTNKKGVAKVTIKKNVLKKLKVGKKVTYSATYGKTTKKVTVKVKK
jgi:hypothetical protein